MPFYEPKGSVTSLEVLYHTNNTLAQDPTWHDRDDLFIGYFYNGTDVSGRPEYALLVE